MISLLEHINENKEGNRLYNEIFKLVYNYISKIGYSQEYIKEIIGDSICTYKYHTFEDSLIEDILNDNWKDNMKWSTFCQLHEYIKPKDHYLCAKETVGTDIVQALIKYRDKK